MQSILSILLLALADATAAYLAPSPPGKYNVTLTTGSLIDYTRNDPYAPSPTPRELMLSIFQPAKCASTVSVPDMPEKIAKYQGPYIEQLFNVSANITPLFLKAQLPVCDPGTCSALEDSPILLFSPGYSIPRLYYNVIASAVASEGFTIITIDHPEDANIIVYPDGHSIYNNASITKNSTWDVYPRAADASFVIDQLSNATAMAELLPQRGARPFKTDRIGMLGHSAGGTAAVVAASQDSRIRGAINWDGFFMEGLVLPAMSQPVLFMARQDIFYLSWLYAWPQLKGPKMVVQVANTTHQTFSDVPTLFEAAGKSTAPLAGLLGTTAPADMVRILTASTAGWMNGAFEAKEDAVFLDKYSDVSVIKKGNF